MEGLRTLINHQGCQIIVLKVALHVVVPASMSCNVAASTGVDVHVG